MWAEIRGYEDLYYVSTDGEVYSVRRKKILKPWKNEIGYLLVTLRKDGVKKNVRVHRLVAEAFIPNPHGYPQINHKDEDKTNPHVDNLEWCDAKYNINFGSGIARRSKRVNQYTLDGKYIKTWDSMAQAARALETHAACISACCRGVSRKCSGYKWTYYIEKGDDVVGVYRTFKRYKPELANRAI